MKIFCEMKHNLDMGSSNNSELSIKLLFIFHLTSKVKITSNTTTYTYTITHLALHIRISKTECNRKIDIFITVRFDSIHICCGQFVVCNFITYIEYPMSYIIGCDCVRVYVCRTQILFSVVLKYFLSTICSLVLDPDKRMQ